MQTLSAYAKDYSDFTAEIDLVAAHEGPAHFLDVSLTDVGTPGLIEVEWDCGTAALPDYRRQPGNVGVGRVEVHEIRRDQVLLGNIRKIVSASGIEVVRAHFPFKKRPEQS